MCIYHRCCHDDCRDLPSWNTLCGQQHKIANTRSGKALSDISRHTFHHHMLTPCSPLGQSSPPSWVRPFLGPDVRIWTDVRVWATSEWRVLQGTLLAFFKENIRERERRETQREPLGRGKGAGRCQGAGTAANSTAKESCQASPGEFGARTRGRRRRRRGEVQTAFGQT